MLLHGFTCQQLRAAARTIFATRSRRATIARALLCGALTTSLVSACDAGGNKSNSDQSQSVTVAVAVNQSGQATGEVNWNLLDNNTRSLRITIPEDTSLQLRLGSAADDSSIAIVTPPKSGAAVLFAGVLEYTPDTDFFGGDSLLLRRMDQTIRVLFQMNPVNDAPLVLGDIDRVAEQGVLFSTRIKVRNVDADILKFSASGLPSWLQLDAKTGELSGTPEQRHVGVHESIRLIVRDSAGLEDVLNSVRIEVLDLNDAPSLNISQFPQELDARQSIDVSVFPDDVDGDSVTLEVEPNDFIRTSVEGGTVSVIALDVNEVIEINMVLIATDVLGRRTRAVVPFVLYPLTQSGKGRTLHGQRTGAGVHLVVIGDGYREEQWRRFRADVEEFIAAMASDPAIARHLAAWNIHMIEAWSVDSGIDDDFPSMCAIPCSIRVIFASRSLVLSVAIRIRCSGLQTTNPPTCISWLCW